MAKHKNQWQSFNQDLMQFLELSPTPFHAVSQMSLELIKNRFTQLSLTDSWQLKAGGEYFLTVNESTLIAFKIAQKAANKNKLRIVGAHTDSPTLKVKPNPDMSSKCYYQLGVEIYGGMLLNPWFDRDLSMAGRVNYQSKKGELKKVYLDFKRPIAVVPSLAIHLDRSANEQRTVNKQKDMPPLILLNHQQNNVHFNDILIAELHSQKVASDIAKVLDYEMYLYDSNKPAYVGLNQDFLVSARLDNLLSCFQGLKALKDTSKEFTSILVCHDHEEVGSCSHHGADSSLVKSVLERIVGVGEDYHRSIHQSFMVSCDNAHALHPNHTEKHDANHGPLLNGGPVIKINSSQRYATNSDTASFFAHICEKVDIPYQKFVVRSDMACGSTIGPISAGNLGVRTVDVGTPQLGMHSIRELTGNLDPHRMYLALKEFFQTQEN